MPEQTLSYRDGIILAQKHVPSYLFRVYSDQSGGNNDSTGRLNSANAITPLAIANGKGHLGCFDMPEFQLWLIADAHYHIKNTLSEVISEIIDMKIISAIDQFLGPEAMHRFTENFWAKDTENQCRMSDLLPDEVWFESRTEFSSWGSSFLLAMAFALHKRRMKETNIHICILESHSIENTRANVLAFLRRPNDELDWAMRRKQDRCEDMAEEYLVHGVIDQPNAFMSVPLSAILSYGLFEMFPILASRHQQRTKDQWGRGARRVLFQSRPGNTIVGYASDEEALPSEAETTNRESQSPGSSADSTNSSLPASLTNQIVLARKIASLYGAKFELPVACAILSCYPQCWTPSTCSSASPPDKHKDMLRLVLAELGDMEVQGQWQEQDVVMRPDWILDTGFPEVTGMYNLLRRFAV